MLKKNNDCAFCVTITAFQQCGIKVSAEHVNKVVQHPKTNFKAGLSQTNFKAELSKTKLQGKTLPNQLQSTSSRQSAVTLPLSTRHRSRTLLEYLLQWHPPAYIWGTCICRCFHSSICSWRKRCRSHSFPLYRLVGRRLDKQIWLLEKAYVFLVFQRRDSESPLLSDIPPGRKDAALEESHHSLECVVQQQLPLPWSRRRDRMESVLQTKHCLPSGCTRDHHFLQAPVMFAVPSPGPRMWASWTRYKAELRIWSGSRLCQARPKFQSL